MNDKKETKWISSFWRRIGAFLIDTLILGGIGFLLGLALEKQFVELGGWGRLIGFLIALPYFGVMNSKLFRGQTLGKRILKLKVVDIDNNSISISRSFIRYSILGVPFFLNGAYITGEILSSYWLYPFSIIVFGGLFAISYLYIFNRITRQSLHDLLVGTFVVNVGIEKQEIGNIWKPHFIVVGLIFVSAAVVPIFTTNLAKGEPFRGLLLTQAEIMKIPYVRYAMVSYGENTFTAANENTKTTSYVSAQIFLKKNSVTDINLAKEIAEVLVRNYPQSLQKDLIQVNLTYGYDIGIASQWRYQSHSFSPEDYVGKK